MPRRTSESLASPDASPEESERAGWPEELQGLLTVIRASPHPMLLWWGEDVHQIHNEAWWSYAGRSGGPAGEPVPARRVWAQGWHVLEPAIAQVRAGRSVRTGEIPFCIEGRPHRETFFILSLSPIRNVEGEVVAILVVCNDATDAQKIRQVQRQAEAASRAKDEFLAMLGHELRNPLAPIVTALELMRMNPDVYTREREVIERQVAHLRRLVDDLLDVSRVIRGKLNASMMPVPVGDVVDRAMEMASPLLEARAQPVSVELGEDLWVEGDPLRLAQVVANLLTNASKYSRKWRPITVRAARDEGELVIAVIDRGIGIPADMLSRLFEPFVQLRRRQGRGPEGLGLGLALVRGLTELHGGRVQAFSDGPGLGSRFEVRLPLLLDRPSPTELPASSVSGVASSISQRRILVVDDNEDAAEMLATILRSHGHQVEVALDGPQALSIAARFDPEVGVLDIGLPVMDGYALCRALRERKGGGRMLIIAVTGYGRRRDRVEALSSGFDDHLVKPLDVETLLDQMAHRWPGRE